MMNEEGRETGPEDLRGRGGVVVRRIVSGGQTGVDRAALDAALELGIECGGWVPKGRLDENGTIPDRYPNLIEADSEVPDVRTELNVRDSDATLIVARAALSGGSAYTREMAKKYAKPCLCVDFSAVTRNEALAKTRAWLEGVKPGTLNVAGPRASRDAAAYGLTRDLLRRVLERGGPPPAR